MIVLAEDFLAGKITIWKPTDDATDLIITISNDVLEALVTTWHLSLVIKALGTKIPYEIMQCKLKELWKPKSRMRVIDLPNGYYWSMDDVRTLYHSQAIDPNFNPMTGVTRLQDLLVILYEESNLLHIASTVGNRIKVDRRTLHTDRGRFVRICIELDLTKPLKGAIVINGSRFLIEYEGLHTIFFGCGRFGHFQPSCLADPKNIAQKTEE
ncbi:hypothetical protein V2J09_010453 [Rumex salicifolius]